MALGFALALALLLPRLGEGKGGGKASGGGGSRDGSSGHGPPAAADDELASVGEDDGNELNDYEDFCTREGHECALMCDAQNTCWTELEEDSFATAVACNTDFSRVEGIKARLSRLWRVSRLSQTPVHV